MAPSKEYGSIQVQDEQPSEDPENVTPSANFPSRGIFAVLAVALSLVVWFAYTDTEHGSVSKVYSAPDYSSSSSSSSSSLSSPHDVELFYKHQLVDHYSDSRDMYAQRYFEDRTFFGGPGSPIFVIIGGEGEIHNVLYPWVSRHIGKTYNALTICVEHRFYGESQPVDPDTLTNEDLKEYLHPRQALADAVRLIRHIQRTSGCGERGTPEYCPVMTIGGSYPGFLSVLLRTVHSDVVDIGYGSSSPLHLYSHYTGDDAYFDKISAVAEANSPGCAEAVKDTLTQFQSDLLASERTVEEEAADLGICLGKIPDYIDSLDILQEEVVMIVAAHFAENNMVFYPPGPDQELVQGCKLFQSEGNSVHERISSFLRMREGFEECFDMTTELPPGPYGTISAADWSGTGDGNSGFMWDFQSCTLIPECSLGPDSMFPPRKWTLSWLTEHCERRFGYTPHPRALVEEFGFEDLSDDSRIILTNGSNDGWSVASILVNVSDTITTFNLENGAHHSDLTHTWPSAQDTPDVSDAHDRIEVLVGTWLSEIMNE